MTRWEYKTGIWKSGPGDGFSVWLNGHGREGWEVVGFEGKDIVGAVLMYVMFKRPVGEAVFDERVTTIEGPHGDV